MPEALGKFIVFEGIDGAGTTTQVEVLARALLAERRLVHTTREPSAGPIGSLLRLGLSGRTTFSSARHAQVMALLFAADRLDHLACEIEPHLREGTVVLCDRYDLSSIAYQSATAGDDPLAFARWVRELNRDAVRPDLTLVLDVAPEVADKRRRQRRSAVELYEDAALQVRLAELYRRPGELVPGDPVVVLDGNRGVDEVAAAVRAALAPVLAS
ncbi:MAG: dTMP kinase [Polyangiaceae bacterium]|nr:dTMP kinase [Polyangiaceae bacterium]